MNMQVPNEATLTSSATASSASSIGTPLPSYARASAPAGAVVVDNSEVPVSGSYSTVQLGVDALSTTATDPQYLFIYPGTYNEQVFVPALASNLTVQGYTLDSRHYNGNNVTIISNTSTSTDDLGATLRQWNANTKFYNINLNSTSPNAPALSAQASGQGYYGMQFLGSSGTLLAQTGYQLYGKCLIVGADSIIHGSNAAAWFDTVDIRTSGPGSIVTSSRDSSNSSSWYVINDSSVASLDSSLAAAQNYLGAAGGAYSRVVVQTTSLGSDINAAGWEFGNESPADVLFGEYENTGEGSISAAGARVSGSQQVAEPETVAGVLGDWYTAWWVDETYFGSKGNP